MQTFLKTHHDLVTKITTSIFVFLFSVGIIYGATTVGQNIVTAGDITAGSITLNGVTNTAWPASDWWATTTDKVGATLSLVGAAISPTTTQSVYLPQDLLVDGNATTTGRLVVGKSPNLSAENLDYGLVSNKLPSISGGYASIYASTTALDAFSGASNLYGVYARINDTANIAGGITGVRASAQGASNQVTGISADVTSFGSGNVYGLYSLANTDTGGDGSTLYGVYGRASNGSSGSATGNQYGLYGVADGISSVGTNYGVYGNAINGAINYAGYFDGNVKTTGSLDAGGKLYIGAVAGAAADGKVVCFNQGTREIYYVDDNTPCSNAGGAASPFLLTISGTTVLSEVLANQWKVEATSINRIDGYDGTTEPTFVLGSYKEKETDYIDSLALQLRCERDQVITTKNYPLNFIGKLGQGVKGNWLEAASGIDGKYFQGREGDKIVVKFEQPQAADWSQCDNKTFAFVANGYYEWEKLEFDEKANQSFFKKYLKYSW